MARTDRPGLRLKLVLNTWLAFDVEAAAEESAIADRLGVPYGALRATAEGGPRSSCWSPSRLASGTAMARLAKMETGDHSAQFPL